MSEAENMPHAAAPRLIMLPGMGTNAPLLEPQAEVFPTLQTPAWLPNEPGETLPAYAARLVKTVDTTPPFYLSGVSFGGMVALEMARHCEPKAVLLIGSARTGRQVPRYIRPFARLGQRVPTWALPFLPRPLIRLHLAVRERLGRENMELLARATAGFDRKLLRWTGGAIARWHFDGELPCPLYQIHGRKDWLLKPPPDDGSVTFIDDGRHMINMTHPEQVNDFIRRCAPDLP